MELFTSQSISTLPNFFSNPTHLRAKTYISLKRPQIPCSSLIGRHHRFPNFWNSVPRETASGETSNGPNQYVAEDRDSAVAVKESLPVEKSVFSESGTTEETKEESSFVEQADDLFSSLNVKFDSEDIYSILLYGSGALVALWLLSAVVGAIDSIPLFPKLMEVVGLGYTLWFTARYLLFKENRVELAAKVEELKQQVIGSIDD